MSALMSFSTKRCALVRNCNLSLAPFDVLPRFFFRRVSVHNLTPRVNNDELMANGFDAIFGAHDDYSNGTYTPNGFVTVARRDFPEGVHQNWGMKSCGRLPLI